MAAEEEADEVTRIQILGTGCPKCKALTANAEAAAKEVGVDAVVEKVTEIQEILKFGVMITPALVIDGHVKSAGKLLSVEEIRKLLE
jgi:small redox-active disulfide protein 2